MQNAAASIMKRSRSLALLLSLSATVGACGPSVDLTKGLQVQVLSSGWLDAGTGGQNKLVPVMAFKLKNVSNEKLVSLQVNALFRRYGDTEDWGSGYLTAAGSTGLVAGAVTNTLTIKSPLGYTSTEPPVAMLGNSHFVDAKVDLFAKYGSTQWTRLGEYPVVRQLVAPSTR